MVDIILRSTMKLMKYEEENIERITMNLVGFNAELSGIEGKVIMLISIRGNTLYYTMMVIDMDSVYNAIFGHP